MTNMNTPHNKFWIYEPLVLLDKKHIDEIFPTADMSFINKLNAITRFVILLSILSFTFTFKLKYITMCLITMGIIITIYFIHKKKIREYTNKKLSSNKEGFSLGGNNIKQNSIDQPTPKNPFSNVLLTDIMDNPNKPPAPLSYQPDTLDNITNNIMKGVQMVNPTLTDTNTLLFGDTYSKYELDQSNRQFYSTANTRIENDQSSFAQFLYGNMPSSKEGDPISLIYNNYRHILG